MDRPEGRARVKKLPDAEDIVGLYVNLACTTLEGPMNHQSHFCAAVSNKDLVDDLADLCLHGIDAPSLTQKHQFRYDGTASAVQATNGLSAMFEAEYKCVFR